MRVGLFLAIDLLLSPRLSRNRMGINEVPDCPDHRVTQGDVSLVSNGLKKLFFVRGNADYHDPISFFRHENKVGYCMLIAVFS